MNTNRHPNAERITGAPQFTPGPWRYEHRSRGHPSFNILVARQAVIVAKAWVVEDARLIAAAPELYEALDALLKGVSAVIAREHGIDAEAESIAFVDSPFAKARRALAKARGEAL